MNQDIRDAYRRLGHALACEARQASLPTDAPTLQLANDLLRVRLEEQERIVAQERARADAAEHSLSVTRAERDRYGKAIDRAADDCSKLEQERDAAMAQLDDAHNALTAAGVALESHTPHEGCATQLGHRVRAALEGAAG